MGPFLQLLPLLLARKKRKKSFFLFFSLLLHKWAVCTIASQREEDSIVGIIPNLEIFPATKRYKRRRTSCNHPDIQIHSSSSCCRTSLYCSKLPLWVWSKVKNQFHSFHFMPAVFLFPGCDGAIQKIKKMFITEYIFVASPYSFNFFFVWKCSTFPLPPPPPHYSLNQKISKRKPIHNSLRWGLNAENHHIAHSYNCDSIVN